MNGEDTDAQKEVKNFAKLRRKRQKTLNRRREGMMREGNGKEADVHT